MKTTKCWDSEVQYLEKEDVRRVRRARHYSSRFSKFDMWLGVIAIAVIVCLIVKVLTAVAVDLVYLVKYSHRNLLSIFGSAMNKTLVIVVTGAVILGIVRYKYLSTEERIGIFTKFRRHWVAFIIVSGVFLSIMSQNIYRWYFEEDAKYLNSKLEIIDDANLYQDFIGNKEWVEDLICRKSRETSVVSKTVAVMMGAAMEIYSDEDNEAVILSDYTGDNEFILNCAEVLDLSREIYDVQVKAKEEGLTDEEFLATAELQTAYAEIMDKIKPVIDTFTFEEPKGVLTYVYAVSKWYTIIFILTEILRRRNTKRFMKQEGYLV